MSDAVASAVHIEFGQAVALGRIDKMNVVRRARVQKYIVLPYPGALRRGYVNHAQAHGAIGFHTGIVGAIDGQEMGLTAN